MAFITNFLVHEANLVQLYKRQGDTFVDVGAFQGTWTVQLAPYYNKVIAFEPHPQSYQQLTENLRAFNVTNVKAERMAVGKTSGKITFFYRAHADHSHVTPDRIPGECCQVVASEEMDCTSLDDYFKGYPGKIDLIKIDTEGAEVEIVEGALNTIKVHRPSLFIEAHGRARLQAVLGLLDFVSFDSIVYPQVGGDIICHLMSTGYK
jgi:FkbM family methyltransferase